MFVVGLYMCFAHVGGGVCCGFIHVFCTCRLWHLFINVILKKHSSVCCSSSCLRTTQNILRTKLK